MKAKVAWWRHVLCYLIGHSDVAAGGGTRFRLFECSCCTRTCAVPTLKWRRQREREELRRRRKL